MKYLVCWIALLALLAVPELAEADAFVRFSGKVQDYHNVTPVEALADTVTFTFQAGTQVTDITSVSVVAQKIDNGDILAGVQVDYAVPLNLAPRLSPYLGFAASINFTDTLDHGVIVSGIGGMEIRFAGGVSGFVEGRSLTWYTREQKSTVGVGAGVLFAF